MPDTQAQQKSIPQLGGFQTCADAVAKMEAVLDGMEAYPDLCGETSAMREQLRRITDACAALASVPHAPVTLDGDPHGAARRLVDSLPLEEVFQDQALSEAFLSELLLALARQSSCQDRRERQREGIAEAKAQGVRFGAPRRPLPDNFQEVCRAWHSGQLSTKDAARRCGLARSTFYNAARKQQASAEEA